MSGGSYETAKLFDPARHGTGLAHEGTTPPSYEQWRKDLSEDPNWNPAGVILAVDGDRWVGMSHVTRLDSGAMYNSFTGVIREHRGRGLALPLKTVALKWARWTGAAVIRTHNHSVNQPMLAINRKLGYTPKPGVYTLTKHT